MRQQDVKKGLTMPAILLVMVVLVLFAGAMTSLGTTGLTAARNDLDSERALYTAEAGLALAAKELYLTSTVPQPFKGSLEDSTYTVEIIKNPGASPMELSDGPTLPPSTIFLRSKGKTRRGVERETWALFRSGLGNFQVGALADEFNVTNSTFTAYDSNSGGQVGEAGILASNASGGLPYTLLNSVIEGSIFVGQGGDPDSLISSTNSSVQRSSALASVVNVPEITVPNLPPAAAEGEPAADPTPGPPPSTWSPPSVGSSCTLAPPASAGAPLVITKNCLTLKILPDGTFSASESGSSSLMTGNILTKTIDPGSSGPMTVNFEPFFNLEGSYHRVILDPTTGKYGSDPSGIASPAPPPVYSDAPDWVWDFLTPAPSLVNPEELASGRYESVAIDSAVTKLKDNSIYVVKDLTVNNAGQLKLPAGAGNVSIYVTRSLNLDGEDTVLNETEKPPLMKLFYTGTSPAVISGGSQAYTTLLAPNAPILLKGQGASFHGALVGTKVTVENAIFNFDTATNGVGTGVDGSALDILARYRP